MTNISIEYTGCAVHLKSFDTVASGAVETVIATFVFDEVWNSYKTKTAIFANGATIKQVILDDKNSCIIPWEVLEKSGTFETGVIGQSGQKIMPGAKLMIRIVEGIYTKGTAPEAPAPDIYEQIVQIMQNALSVAQSVRDDADAGKFIGLPGKDGYTPVRGADYWTPADKAEIDAYIDEKLGDVESALDELHAYANALVGGDA